MRIHLLHPTVHGHLLGGMLHSAFCPLHLASLFRTVHALYAQRRLCEWIRAKAAEDGLFRWIAIPLWRLPRVFARHIIVVVISDARRVVELGPLGDGFAAESLGDVPRLFARVNVVVVVLARVRIHLLHPTVHGHLLGGVLCGSLCAFHLARLLRTIHTLNQQGRPNVRRQ